MHMWLLLMKLKLHIITSNRKSLAFTSHVKSHTSPSRKSRELPKNYP